MKRKIGIISDTHNRIDKKVLLTLSGCDCILHAGDVCSDRILDQLRPLGSLYVVRGNCDYGAYARKLREKLSFSIDGVRFLMIHDRYFIGSEWHDADVIIHGHTHRYRCENKQGHIWLNPGSCSMPRGGGKTMAVMTIEDGMITGIQKIVLD